jgi:hypothetical protein
MCCSCGQHAPANVRHTKACPGSTPFAAEATTNVANRAVHGGASLAQARSVSTVPTPPNNDGEWPSIKVSRPSEKIDNQGTHSICRAGIAGPCARRDSGVLGPSSSSSEAAFLGHRCRGSCRERARRGAPLGAAAAPRKPRATWQLLGATLGCKANPGLALAAASTTPQPNCRLPMRRPAAIDSGYCKLK